MNAPQTAEEKALRLGVLGGTFDPPHLGHLATGQEVACRLGLDRVLLVPARQNPLKSAVPSATAEQRLRMLELAVADDPLFQVSAADLDRPGPSYTIDLLEYLEHKFLSAELLFLVGADA